MKIRLFLLLASVCSLTTVSAQNYKNDYRAIYDEAESNYEIGRFEEAERLLTENIKGFPDELIQSVYRLLALTSIGTDNEEAAEEYVRQLLNENPYYTTTPDDRPRFIDLVENIKSGFTTTITTASSQSEKLSEVPVPTTLITEEMIHNCGGSNLQEILTAYVPGMTIVDCNTDPNIAMRGIYSNSQEKILIMLNGHRLNSYCTNIASLGYDISLDKIKQIEVLRGPASSLYGGVALTAVINIITKQGAEVNGVKLRAGIGNHKTMHGDILWGKHYFDLDVLIWGSIYKSAGENFYVESPDNEEPTVIARTVGEITVAGFGNKPTYDMGINMKWKNMQFFYSSRFSQAVSPFTMSYLYQPYDLNRYSTYNGIKPSYATQSHHANISYGRKLGKVFLKGTVTYDNNDVTHYQVLTDQPQGTMLGILLNLPEEIIRELTDKEGLSRYINGQEQALGANIKGDVTYANSSSHKGNFSFGAEFNHFSLDDCRYVLGHSFNSRIPETNTISELAKGYENSYDGFAQLKHQWRSLILNAGLRYDFKRRYDGSDINEFSPRLALILVQPKWNLKLSYSKAFIDAPYLYRKTNDYFSILTGQRQASLSPESYHAYQITFAGTRWVRGLDFEINGFLSRARDLIYMELITHRNTGNTDTYGVELTGNYTSKRLTGNLTMTWQKLSKSKIFNYHVKKSFNIPNLTANLTLGWQVLRQLKLHTHLSYASTQTSYAVDLLNAFSQILLANTDDSEKESAMAILQPYLKQQTGTAIEFIDVPSRILADFGVSYKPLKFIEINFNVHNAFNKHYTQSGMATGQIPQKGRWFMFDVCCAF